MGFGGISLWQLLIVLIIVILLFGTKKLRSLGGDLGSAIRSFKTSIREGEDEDEKKDEADSLKYDNETEQHKQQHEEHDSTKR